MKYKKGDLVILGAGGCMKSFYNVVV